MAKKTARDFSRKMIAQIAIEYAKTECEYSHDYFSRKYDISESTFYTVLEKAVTENIVSDDIVMWMSKKAQTNSAIKAGKGAGIRSERHYNYLVLKRKQFMLKPKEAILLTTEYAKTKLSKDEFCKVNYITVSLLNRTIREAIIKNLIADEVVAKLKEKSLQKNSGISVIEFWEELENSRRENKKNQE